VNRGLGAGLALSVLAHCAAVVAIGVVGVAWLMGPPAASTPPALYVDLVDPVVATSDRQESVDGPGSPRPTKRSETGGRTAPGGARGAAPSIETATPAVPEASPPVDAPAWAASATLEVPQTPAPPPMPKSSEAPVDASPRPSRALDATVPVPRPAAPPIAPAAPDPEPRDRAMDSGTSASPAFAANAAPATSSSDLTAARPGLSGSARSAARESAAGTGERAETPAGDGTAGGDARGPIVSGQPGAGGGTEFARLTPGTGQSGSAPDGAIPPEYESYVRALRQRIQDRLVYPSVAVRRNQQGVVELELHLGADGRLVAVEVVAGVSAETLRGAAVSAVRGSAPFPLPPGLAPRPLVVRLPVEFRLR